MEKNIVLCLDGTGNEFGDSNSNVVKIYSILTAEADRQAVYYHPGLGTMGAPNAMTRIAKKVTRLLGLAFGYGLTGNIASAYEFLMNTYEPGDRVYVFGFSRGAYTARALCGMLHMFGLIRKGNPELIPYAYRLFKFGDRRSKKDLGAAGRSAADKAIDHSFELAREFQSTFCRPCPIHFAGLWDTVSSVGWIYEPVKLPYTKNNPSVCIVRHAVSIDERRCFYRQNLWGEAAPGQDIRQLWFAGVHSDVGGGYPAAEAGLSNIALDWMIAEAASAGLLIEEPRLAALRKARERVKPQVMVHKSLRGFWWILEFWPKRRYKKVENKWVPEWRIYRGRRRVIEHDAVVHESVLELLGQGYDPPNLPPEIKARRIAAVQVAG